MQNIHKGQLGVDDIGRHDKLEGISQPLEICIIVSIAVTLM